MRTIYRALASVIGATLSLAGCSDGGPFDPGGNNAAEYGVPSARYNVTGRVLDQVNGSGIAGIRVNLGNALADTTDADGNWSLEGQSFFGGETVTLEVADIDGPLNGSYEDRFAEVDLEQTAPGQGDWQQGLYEAHGVDIEMAEETPGTDVD